ncbi:putative lipoprotein YiaD [Fundidesulfovibrio magnetotacticus]|uniref:Putative lipoprotein YiaD n=1 Tax=Fundidesulfovibrio magnetotacticus TaxID=2730080 RepID=A0A6V8M2A0_9BACT|nr:OmpA family protein [Fundidesulfovibrio magnetotacticus]GFK95947.1 putative lipoprotein YiaD [Fundidesulfovibrio magnetotacticus]
MHLLAFLFLFCFAGVQAVQAQQTVYPSSEAEIVRSLKKTRGLAGVAADAPAPRVAARVLFDTGSDQVRPDSFALLDEFGKALSGQLARQRFELVGHTDDRGGAQYNLELSQRRANSVKAWLVSRHGVDPDRLETRGAGLADPVAANDTEEGRAANRRVEFKPLP